MGAVLDRVTCLADTSTASGDDTTRRRLLLPKYERNVPWKVQYNGHYCDWVKREAESWNFDPGIYCITSKEINPTQVSPHSLHFSVVDTFPYDCGNCGRVTNVTLKERTNKDPSKAHYLHLPYRLKLKSSREAKAESAGLKPMQVCCYHKNLIVLQALSKDHHLQFIVFDLCSREFLGKYMIKWTWESFMCECVISPNHKFFLIKPSIFYGTENANRTNYPYLREIRVVHFSNSICKLHDVIRDVNCAKYIMAFDPRYGYSKLALGNWSREDGDTTKDCVCMFDVVKKSPVMHNMDTSLVHSTKNLVFSPDGSFLASLINEPCYYQDFHNFPKILVYDSDSLEVVHSIACTNTQCVPLYPALLFPTFSRCGTRMVVGYGRDIDIMGAVFGQEIAFVDVNKVPIPINLQYLCRVFIRHLLPRDEQLTALPLPKAIVNYLQFGPVFEQ